MKRLLSSTSAPVNRVEAAFGDCADANARTLSANDKRPTIEPADEQLMSDYRDGDASAFDRLYARHKGCLYRYLLRQCSGAAIAEELFQDTWFNLIKSRLSYRPTAKFTTYLYRLAHNRLVDFYRKQQRDALLSYSQLSDAETVAAPADTEPEQRLYQWLTAERLLTLLDRLPAAQRETFLLRHEAGLSIGEIAEVTNVPFENAKSRLRYAMANLRHGLMDDDG